MLCPQQLQPWEHRERLLGDPLDKGIAQGGSAADPSHASDSLEHSASSRMLLPKPSVLPSCLQGDRIVTAHLPLLQAPGHAASLCLCPISDLFLHGFSHWKREMRFALFYFNLCVDR